MVTRNVVLTERQEKLLEALVESGRYQNASEVMREGLRLIEQREAEDAAKLAALREAVRQGEASIEAGHFREFDSFDELDTHLNDLAAKAMRKSQRR
jgi:antitoxin ParD1/3/4